jgi:hypothetical protein
MEILVVSLLPEEYLTVISGTDTKLSYYLLSTLILRRTIAFFYSGRGTVFLA